MKVIIKAIFGSIICFFVGHTWGWAKIVNERTTKYECTRCLGSQWRIKNNKEQ